MRAIVAIAVMPRLWGKSLASQRPIGGSLRGCIPYRRAIDSAAGSTTYAEHQHKRMPTPPITPKWRKPRNTVIISEA